MFARSRDPRAVLTILGALAPFASSTISGCGSSGSSPATGGSEGGATYTTVVTTGGGIPDDAAPTDPFESSSSGASSSGSSSGGSSGVAEGGTSSGGDASDASSSSSSSGGPDASSSSSSGGEGGVAYVPPVCGVQSGAAGCDLRTSTCCLTQTLIGTCVAKGTACPSGQASVGCLQALECPSGQSCCGVVEDIQGAVISGCQNVPLGGHCPYSPYTPVSLYQGVQLCKTDAECKSLTDAGTPDLCIHQTCFMGAMLSMCGVQSTAPLSCSASP